MATISDRGIEPQKKALKRTGAALYSYRMAALMLAADLAGFGAAAALVLVLSGYLMLFASNTEYLSFVMIPLISLVLFTNSKLYPGVGINPAQEIKLVTRYVTIGFASGWLLLVWSRAGWAPNHLALPVLWALSVLSILLLRWSVRIVAAKLGVWGEPVAVMGDSEGVQRTIRYFIDRHRLGYFPAVAVLTADGGRTLTPPLPVIDRTSLLKSASDRFASVGIQTLLVDGQTVSGFSWSEDTKILFRLFRRVILVSDVGWLEGASMQLQDFEGLIGISAEKNVLSPVEQLLKRALDVLVSAALGLILLPVLLALAALIRLDSPGIALYSQERLGKGGRKIRILKFRSMVENADSILEEHFRKHPDARREWEVNGKLRDDPRTTRIGRFLRRYSLDELPQLLNVLKGDMSLVGPRPLPDYHYRLLSENVRTLRAKLRPGLTGMWQVSGRSDSGTRGMEIWDSYYASNWSLWLDLYILMRTVWVVFSRDGAY